MGGAERIAQKLRSIVDEHKKVCDPNSGILDLDNIKAHMKSGKEIHDLSEHDVCVPYDISEIKLPYLKEFVKKYPYFLRDGDKNLS